MVGAPRTRYATHDGVDVAYQVLGDGPDLLLFTGFSVPIDCVESEPSLARFHRRLASFARVIRFDLSGIGMSGHLAPGRGVGLQQWVEDAVSVLDAAGSTEAVVFAPVTAALMGLTLAADHPERIRKLIVVNGGARARWAPDYPAGVGVEAVTRLLELGAEPDAVAQGFDALSIMAPSVAADPVFRDWWDRSGNRAATPTMARTISAVLADGDVRARLADVTAPTLVLHRSQNPFIPVAHGRYLAENIPGATYVELPGADSIYWTEGDILDHVEQFVTGGRGPDAERALATVLFTDIVGSTEHAGRLGDSRWRALLENHDRMVRRELSVFGGREIKTAGDGFLATFAGPSAAMDCARSVLEAVRPLGVTVRAGVHAGEVELVGGDVAGMAVHIAARVAALAAGDEVLVSSTVRELVTGSARRFDERGEHQLKGVPGRWTLYAVQS